VRLFCYALLNAYLLCNIVSEWLDSKVVRVSEYRVSSLAERLWRVAVLTAAGTIAVTSQAEAAIYYWQNSYPGYSQFAPMFPQRRQKTRHQPNRKSVVADTKDSKPQGPLIISISIAQQNLRVYDANGLFAESPVSTGMPGHPTPMGVFSVIQKQKYHRSNIYSGAPMPYMQRITWSGVAMHAGVLPGHPASHGCIRMPMAFATKMWNWTRMGARVVITPSGVTPESFTHSLLATVKVPPRPAEETKSDEPAGAKLEKAAEVEAGARPVVAETKIELRSSIGDSATPAADEKLLSAASQTRTADASKGLPTAKPSVMMSDAAPAVAKAEARADSAKAEPSKTGAETPVEIIKPAVASTAMPEAGKGSPRTADAVRVAMAKADPVFAAKRTGQIAVFVSRKDSKLYVRQNFSPLFDMPVTVALDERPLGTHIFTAQVDKDDANVLHWSAVSLPAPSRRTDRRIEDERGSYRRKAASVAPIETRQMPMSDSPAEALDRLSLPADVMARIYEALSTGSSIIVSDQGIAAGETGEGTDFIVSLR
jgi:lipoprotein-anchoring transpeptidase ErfK/SrfK